MKLLKRIACFAIAAIMVFAMAACSTPKIAITVDGKEYTTGEYLAYMFTNFNYIYQQGGYSYAYQQGYDIWSQQVAYEDKQLDLEAYIKASTVDYIVRQKAIENMMAQAGLQPDEKLVKEAKEYLDSLTAEDWDLLLGYGIGKESYTNMYMALNCYERTLFLSRYDKDGTTPVPEADIRKYFDDNYLSVKMISVEMMQDNKEMSADEQKKIKDDLQKYLDMYNSGKKTFNEVIAQYKYDNNTASNKKVETLTDEDTRKDIEVSALDNKQFTDAIKSIPEGKAELVTFKSEGTTLTAAVILRMDPEKGEGDAYKDVFANSRQSILLSIKGEAFETDVQKVADALKVDLDNRAYDMCSPRDFLS